MKAIRAAAYGGAENLRLDEIDRPTPGEGQALVKIAYAGINFIDVYMRDGLYKSIQTYAQKPPFVLGMEGAGTVEAVGAGVTDVKVGDRVAYCIELGSYAQYAVVPSWKLITVPADIDMKVATALQLQGSTAHYLSHSLFRLEPGHSCLIHAGAGGVGQLLIQLAKARGAEVFTTVGTPEKAAIAKRRGADHTILYREVDFREKVMEITKGVGVNVVYDSVGQDTIMGSMRSLKRRGTVCNFGASSGAVTSVDPLDLAEAGSVFFTRPHLAHYIATAEERRGRMKDLFEFVRSGKLDVAIDKVFPLKDAADAHRTIEGRLTTGKLLLDVAGA